MPLKARLKGLCETILHEATCPQCGDHIEDWDDKEVDKSMESFPTLEGIVITLVCEVCTKKFIPSGQETEIFDTAEYYRRVSRDREKTGRFFWNLADIKTFIANREKGQ